MKLSVCFLAAVLFTWGVTMAEEEYMEHVLVSKPWSFLETERAPCTASSSYGVPAQLVSSFLSYFDGCLLQSLVHPARCFQL